MKTEDFLVSINSSIMETLEIINKNPFEQVAFVISDDKVVGSVTDGDVRRCLLSGTKKEDCVKYAMNKNFVFAETLTQARAMSEKYHCVPVVDKGKIVCVAFRGGFTVDNPIDIPVVIQAGGLGTRLYPYTKILPKPLIPIGEKPIIEHIIDKFVEIGCSQFYVIVNQKKAMIKSYFSEIDKKYDIHFIDEEIPLGTGGGISLLKGIVDETFILTNCDVLLDIDFTQLIKYHTMQKNIITMVCAKKKVVIPYGVIETDNKGKILNIKEKPIFELLTNTGIYVVEKNVIDEMTEGEFIGFPTVFDRYRNNGNNVSVFSIEEEQWMDMGQLDELDKMKKKLSIID